MKVKLKHCPICKHTEFWNKDNYKPGIDGNHVQCKECWSIINVKKALEIKLNKGINHE